MYITLQAVRPVLIQMLAIKQNIDSYTYQSLSLFSIGILTEQFPISPL